MREPSTRGSSFESVTITTACAQPYPRLLGKESKLVFQTNYETKLTDRGKTGKQSEQGTSEQL